MRTRADLKGITNAAVPLYGSTRCHLMVQGTLGFESGRVFFDGRCFTHRGERHSFAIDAEIACLERAKALLSASGTVVARRKPGRAAKVAIAVAPKVQKARKRRRISAEGRERVRQAQIKRWAALKSASKANMNATVAPLPKVKKKAAKAA